MEDQSQEKEKIKVGSVVALNHEVQMYSTPTYMTITGEYDHNEWVCAWFDGGQIVNARFPEKALTVIS